MLLLATTVPSSSTRGEVPSERNRDFGLDRAWMKRASLKSRMRLGPVQVTGRSNWIRDFSQLHGQ